MILRIAGCAIRAGNARVNTPFEARSGSITHRQQGCDCGSYACTHAHTAGACIGRGLIETLVEIYVAVGLGNGASLRCSRPTDGEQDGCHEHGSSGPGHALAPHSRPRLSGLSRRGTPSGALCTRREPRPARPLRRFPRRGCSFAFGCSLYLAPRVRAVPGPLSEATAIELRHQSSVEFRHAIWNFLFVSRATYSVSFTLSVELFSLSVRVYSVCGF